MSPLLLGVCLRWKSILLKCFLSCRCLEFEQVNPRHLACQKTRVNPQLMGMGQVVLTTINGVVLSRSEGDLQ